MITQGKPPDNFKKVVEAPLPPSSAVVVDSHRVPSIGDRVHRLARVYISVIVHVVRLKKKSTLYEGNNRTD